MLLAQALSWVGLMLWCFYATSWLGLEATCGPLRLALLALCLQAAVAVGGSLSLDRLSFWSSLRTLCLASAWLTTQTSRARRCFDT